MFKDRTTRHGNFAGKMTGFNRKAVVFLFMAVTLMTLGSVASAGSIGINMGSDVMALAPADVAGVDVAQPNWNNAANANGSLSGLVDDGGIGTAAAAAWSAYGTWNSAANGTATGDAKLMYGYTDPVWGDWTADVTVSGIPYDSYDVYVYVGSNNVGALGKVTDGTTTYYYENGSYNPGGDEFQAADYLLTTDIVDDGVSPLANYAVFGNLTGDSVSVSVSSDGGVTGIYGVQIVEVPEPMTLILLGLGGLGLIRRSRRA